MKFERILKVENLEKYYGKEDKRVLSQLNFDLLEGEFLGLMGKSGSGKTTILNCLACIGSFNKGSISYFDKDISLFKRRAISSYRKNVISYIYQDFKLIDILTAYENIILPLTISSKPIDKDRVLEIAKILEIENILDSYPENLSGGEKQRVAIARALLKDAKIILADEPTSSLDSLLSQKVLRLLKTFNKVHKRSIIMASHDLKAISFTDRVLFLDDGKIYNELRRKEDESREEFLVRIENADRQFLR
ncbi:ABC transporter ATP-binding protein [Anaerococcus lactolyticus]|uniref:ABC transporter domain-containing protein n=1 Tax=Anaerococcus lactolyticus S7-1-13 TaxID=1284686 RepID=A0A095X4G0_9FIRM|nr:ABC transporter ATP-binding protein [Anaerococcus lactolyticus]KGF04561.1 hypothetical protein HMPREF1630_03590 [Anaerococcus lactolyticus S7-1-13]